jgi:ferredoxin-type protein NapH
MKRQRIRKTILLISMLLFPITLNYLSPYLVIRGGFEGVLSGSAMVFAGMFLSSLFFGRVFCGWVCPVGALQDAAAAVNDKPVGRRLRRLKYFIWVPWLGAIVAGFISAGGIKLIDPIYCTDYGISISRLNGVVIYFLVVALIVVISLAVGKRAFCHSVCWMAPFMVLGSLLKEKLRIPGLRLTVDADKCTGCRICEKNCPMSLPVSDMVQSGKIADSECILCGSCADRCVKGAVSLRFCAVKPVARVSNAPDVDQSPDTQM